MCPNIRAQLNDNSIIRNADYNFTGLLELTKWIMNLKKRSLLLIISFTFRLLTWVGG